MYGDFGNLHTYTQERVNVYLRENMHIVARFYATNGQDDNVIS